MGYYNVKVLHYINGKKQIRIYTKPQSHGDIENEYHDNEFIEELKKKIKKEEDQDPDEERASYVSKNRTVQEIYNITRSNNWDWFITLTFDPEKVNSFDYSEVTKKLSTWLNNIKKMIAPDLKYLIVPELHKSGRYHFHGLIANTGSMIFTDSGKIDFDGQKIYNMQNYKLGFTTASKIKDLGKACSYVSKYITKELFILTKGKKRYWHSKNLNVPDVEELNLTYPEIQELKLKLANYTTYTKTQEINFLQTKVQYWEIDENIGL